MTRIYSYVERRQQHQRWLQQQALSLGGSGPLAWALAQVARAIYDGPAGAQQTLLVWALAQVAQGDKDGSQESQGCPERSLT